MSVNFNNFSIDIPPQTPVNKSLDIDMVLPKVRGTYQFDYELGQHSFFKTGGKADVLFTPDDVDDLLFFIKNKPKDFPVTVIGNMSNTLVLDGGVKGVVINIKKFQHVEFSDGSVNVEAGVNLGNFIQTCIDNNISCCEMLYMIPGTVGGALFMNAGVLGFEIKSVVNSINIIDLTMGHLSQMSAENMKYRNGNIPKNSIVTSCVLRTKNKDKEQLKSLLSEIIKKRKTTQPIGYATCGSTFKNPEGTSKKAWQLIRDAGCEKMSVGDASISTVHSNFIVNNGRATSADILTLMNDIKMRVFDMTGIMLQEEIKIIGEGFYDRR